MNINKAMQNNILNDGKLFINIVRKKQDFAVKSQVLDDTTLQNLER